MSAKVDSLMDGLPVVSTKKVGWNASGIAYCGGYLLLGFHRIIMISRRVAPIYCFACLKEKEGGKFLLSRNHSSCLSTKEWTKRK